MAVDKSKPKNRPGLGRELESAERKRIDAYREPRRAIDDRVNLVQGSKQSCDMRTRGRLLGEAGLQVQKDSLSSKAAPRAWRTVTSLRFAKVRGLMYFLAVYCFALCLAAN